MCCEGPFDLSLGLVTVSEGRSLTAQKKKGIVVERE